jgi:hypothetical protein
MTWINPWPISDEVMNSTVALATSRVRAPDTWLVDPCDVQRADQPRSGPPLDEADPAEPRDESFDWAEFEAWEVGPSQDAFLWMVDEDE